MKLGAITAISALVFGGAFALGAFLGDITNRAELDASAMARGDKPRKPLTALMATGSGQGAQIDQILSTHRSSFSSSIYAIARLVRETELENLPALVRDLEHDLPEMHLRMLRELLTRRLQNEKPEELLAILHNDADIGRQMVNAILDVGVSLSPDQTFAIIGSEESPKRRRKLREAALRVEIRRDPTSAIRRIAKLPADEIESVIFGNMARLAKAAPDEIAKIVATIPPEPNSNNDLARELFQRLAEKDAPGATEKLDLLTDPIQREGAAERIAKHWPADDLEAGLAWAATEENNSGVYRELLSKLAIEAPQTALSQIDRITDLADRSRLVTSAGSGWLQRDPATATAWLDENLSWRARQDAYTTAVLKGTTNGENIAKLLPVFERIEPTDTAATTFATRWVRADPEAAAGYVRGLTAGPTRKLFERLLAEAAEREEAPE